MKLRKVLDWITCPSCGVELNATELTANKLHHKQVNIASRKCTCPYCNTTLLISDVYNVLRNAAIECERCGAIYPFEDEYDPNVHYFGKARKTKFCSKCGKQITSPVKIIQLPSEWHDWNIIASLGTGGFGTVYKASRYIRRNAEENSAIKIVSIPKDKNELEKIQLDAGEVIESTDSFIQDIVDRYLDEVEAMASLKHHSNIVSMEDFRVIETFSSELDSMQYMIFIREEMMETLRHYCKEKSIDETIAIKIGIDICTALESLESVHLIHRDISEDNILVTTQGNRTIFKLSDFGIAKRITSSNSSLTRNAGKTFHIPPEVYLRGEQTTTVDTYGLGMTLYRLINSGRPPFIDLEVPLSYRVLEKAEDIRVYNKENVPSLKNISEGFSHILVKALSYNSSDRFQNATEMKKALSECLQY